MTVPSQRQRKRRPKARRRKATSIHAQSVCFSAYIALTVTIGNFIPFVSKGDEKVEAKEPQKSPKADNNAKKDTKHGRSESHHVGAMVQKPESTRKDNTSLKESTTNKPVRATIFLPSF